MRDLSKFGHDVHNTLDWGVLMNRANADATAGRILARSKDITLTA